MQLPRPAPLTRGSHGEQKCLSYIAEAIMLRHLRYIFLIFAQNVL